MREETTNLSKIKREKMLNTISTIKQNITDKEMLDNLSDIENELTKKKYGLLWEEHEERVDKELETQIPTFEDIKDKKIVKNNDKFNFLLEGDNLHSLYLLEKTHKGKIDFIYIDPPYNTGNKDFKYDDNFVIKEDTYVHSKWLSFMSKRLKIAKKLLKETGLIFISIDDNEQAQLKLLCDEVFGEENFIGSLIRKTKTTTNDIKTGFNIQHENCHIYAKIKNKSNLLGGTKDTSKYKNPDNDPLGGWIISDPSAKSGTNKNNYFAIINPYTKKEDYPPQGMFWRFSKNTINKHIDNGTIVFKKEHKPTERGFIYKRHLCDLRTLHSTLDSLSTTDNLFMNATATKEAKMLNFVDNFKYPKPNDFIKKILLHSTTSTSTILDFFAGSGTTAQAVMELNKEDGGNRQFILCTNNENNICEEITYQRIKKVIEGYGNKEGIATNLKYFKTAYIPKINDDNNNLRDNLLINIKNLISLENGIDIDDEKIRVILSEKNIDDFSNKDNELKNCNKLYISSNIILTNEQEKLFDDNNIEVLIIPEYYFDEEIRSAE